MSPMSVCFSAPLVKPVSAVLPSGVPREGCCFHSFLSPNLFASFSFSPALPSRLVFPFPFLRCFPPSTLRVWFPMNSFPHTRFFFSELFICFQATSSHRGSCLTQSQAFRRLTFWPLVYIGKFPIFSSTFFLSPPPPTPPAQGTPFPGICPCCSPLLGPSLSLEAMYWIFSHLFSLPILYKVPFFVLFSLSDSEFKGFFPGFLALSPPLLSPVFPEVASHSGTPFSLWLGLQAWQPNG